MEDSKLFGIKEVPITKRDDFVAHNVRENIVDGKKESNLYGLSQVEKNDTPIIGRRYVEDRQVDMIHFNDSFFAHVRRGIPRKWEMEEETKAEMRKLLLTEAWVIKEREEQN